MPDNVVLLFLLRLRLYYLWHLQVHHSRRQTCHTYKWSFQNGVEAHEGNEEGRVLNHRSDKEKRMDLI